MYLYLVKVEWDVETHKKLSTETLYLTEYTNQTKYNQLVIANQNINNE